MRTAIRLTVAALLLVPSTVLAQSGHLAGAIVDPSNAVLPGVTMQATLAAGDQQTTSTVHTDRTGRYEFTGLTPGDYLVTASLPGFETLRASVAVAGDVEQNFTLQIGSIEETINIVAGEPPRAPVRYAQPPLPQPPPAAPGTVRVGGNLKPPTKIGNVSPIYPAALAAQRVGGQVVLNAVIGTDGLVRDVTVVSSPDAELTRAASDALTAWEFSPTLLNGLPIETRIRGTFHFVAN